MQEEKINQNTEKNVCMFRMNEECPSETLESQKELFSLGRTAQYWCQLTYKPEFLFTPLTLLLWIVNPITQRKMKIRCLFDNASNVSLLRYDLAKALGLIGEQIDLQFTSSGGESHQFKNQNECLFQLMDLQQRTITPVIQAGTLPVITADFKPLVLDVSQYEHLRLIDDYTEDYSKKNRKFCEIDLLLGIPYHFHYGPFGRTLGKNLDEPIAIHTQFGSIVSAKIAGQQESLSTQLEQTEFEAMAEKQIEQWMSLEPLGISDSPEMNNDMTWAENECRKIIVENTEYVDNKYYRTVLPWKAHPIKENNQARALAATVSWVKKLEARKPDVLEQWLQCYQDGLEKGLYMKVPAEDMQKTENFHYIVTFPVIKPESLTHAVRLVFAANQKMPLSSRSLNDHLYTGPCELQDLVQLLVRFRATRHVLAMDISRMFFRFLLGPGDQDYLRFFLVSRDRRNRITYDSYRCTGLPFGLNSSVFTATFLMKEHARKYLDDPEYNEASRAILEMSYMDDLLIPAQTEKALEEKVRKVQHILNQASLPTYKFVSSSKNVIENFPKELHSAKTTVSILGIKWDSEQDTLTFKMVKPPQEETTENEMSENSSSITRPRKNRYETGLTKRSLLSIIARIYDNMGYVCPYILQAKLILQETWNRKSNWDDVLDEDLKEKFKLFLEEIPMLEEITIPRCFLNAPDATVGEICTFSDASYKAYSCVVYLISVTPNGERSANLAFAKSRIRPLGKRLQKLSEEMSICRMELLGATIAAAAGAHIRKSFPETQEIKMRFMCDSQVTLFRLKADYTTYKPFVANRLKQIARITSTDDWYFVESELNGADLPSRGGNLSDLVSSREWWKGPSFLEDPSHNYCERKIKNIQLAREQLQNEKEEKAQTKTELQAFNHQLMLMDPVDLSTINNEFRQFWTHQNPADQQKSGLLYKFSSWSKLLRILARVLQFVKAAKKGWAQKSEEKPAECLLKLNIDEIEDNRAKLNKHKISGDLLEETQIFLFRIAQYTDLAEEVVTLRSEQKLSRSSPIFRLRPVWDPNDCVLRMTGRAPSTSLILLPKFGRVSELFVHHVHNLHNHIGVNALMTRVENSGCHLIGGAKAYKRIIKCCICRPPRQLFQEVASLPIERVATSLKSFYFIALDYAGPFILKKESGSGNEEKVWCMIASCLVTRFIHVEVVNNCSTEAFLDAFRSYVALRGLPKKIYSDNATYFKSADKQLKKVLREIRWTEIEDHEKGIEWVYFPPLASAKAGIIEICVRLFKVALTKALQFAYKSKRTPRKLTRSQFRVIVLEVTALVNDRPLGPVYFDRESNNDVIHVTPNQLVYGRNSKIIPAGMKDVSWEDANVSEVYKIRAKIIRMFFKEYLTHYQRSLKFTKQFFEELKGEIPIGSMVLLSEKQFKPGRYSIGTVTNVYKRDDGKISRLEVKTPENKNPVYRDIRQCYMVEHDFLNLVSPTHKCLINGLGGSEDQKTEVPIPAALLTILCNK